MIYHDGECPLCSINEHIPMQLNSDDFWECPECHLVISGADPAWSVVLKEKGRGEYHTSGMTADNFIAGRILIPQEEDVLYHKALFEPFESRKDLKSWLIKNRVNPG